MTIFAETTLGKLVNSKLDIAWGSCQVYEDLGIKRCDRRGVFGHKTASYKKEQICTIVVENIRDISPRLNNHTE